MTTMDHSKSKKHERVSHCIPTWTRQLLEKNQNFVFEHSTHQLVIVIVIVIVIVLIDVSIIQ